MEEFTIKNWRKYQHYADRNPPWIKLHFEILSSEDWVMLADASRVLMVASMLVGSRNSGKIPNNPEYFKRLCHLKNVDFNPLIDIGFLVRDSNGKQALADARPETETETEKEKPIAPHDEKPIVTVPKLTWDRKFIGITAEMTEAWSKAYPACDIAQHLYRMDQWLLSNPAKAKKKNYYRFITNWLSKAQEKGGR